MPETKTKTEDLTAPYRHQDVVEDIFDLGLLAFGVIWAITEKRFTQETLATMAMAGSTFRVLGRRVFRVIVGPRITAWVERNKAKNPSSDDETAESVHAEIPKFDPDGSHADDR